MGIGSIIAWIVLGAIAGVIAKAIYPGHQGGGIFATVALGIVGAFVGGWLGGLLGIGAVGGFSIASIITAIVGAIIVIFIWGLVTRRAA